MRNGITTLTPHIRPFQGSHVITHFKAHTITCELQIEPSLKNHAIHTLSIHHKNMLIGSKEYNQKMNDIANILQILATFNQVAPLMPSNILQ